MRNEKSPENHAKIIAAQALLLQAQQLMDLAQKKLNEINFTAMSPQARRQVQWSKAYKYGSGGSKTDFVRQVLNLQDMIEEMENVAEWHLKFDIEVNP